MRRLLVGFGVILLLAATVGLAAAQSGYRVSWWTVDGGGGRLEGATGYALLGTGGQPDAGPLLSSASYTLSGGFSSGAPAEPAAGDHRVFLPIVAK